MYFTKPARTVTTRNLAIECRLFSFFKGTVSVISSDPLCKYDNARFTTVPLKALSDQV